jgi:hypothetical protein
MADESACGARACGVEIAGTTSAGTAVLKAPADLGMWGRLTSTSRACAHALASCRAQGGHPQGT